MTLATAITFLRIIMVPVFMALLLVEMPYGSFFAAVVFTLAAATDGLDGYIARSRNEVTKLGIMIDPLADKLLVSSALVSLVQLGRISAWIAMLIIGREFAVTALRAMAASSGVMVPASIWGKVKTFAQIVAVVASIIKIPGDLFLMWAAVFLTIWSGLDYFLKVPEMIRQQSGAGPNPEPGSRS
ncbi:MAG: CDP-diacylglycerol--glycerol-3-phosphate 3-phosphatidyltransferase [Syntrophothermus sp.]